MLDQNDLLLQIKQILNEGEVTNKDDVNFAFSRTSSGAGSVDMKSLMTTLSTIVQGVNALDNKISLTNESLSDLQDTVSDGVEDRIIEGLDVTATEPPSNRVDIVAGKAIVGGKIYSLLEDKSAYIPLDGAQKVLYLNLYQDALEVSTLKYPHKKIIAKIIVEHAEASAIQDDRPDNGFNAYIVSGKDLLFDNSLELDDDSITQFRNIMDELLSDNLIGNIRLSEDLKITNTQGTVEIDSQEMRLLYPNKTVGSRFNKFGTFFYDEDGREVARFARGEAYISNVQITPTGLLLTNGADILIQDNGFIKIDSGAGATTLIDASRIFIGQTTGVTTTLNGAALAGAETITVVSTANFASSGFLTVNGTNIIKYTGKTATTFIGIPESGAYSIEAQSNGTVVIQGQGIDLAGADGSQIYIDINGVDGQYIKPASVRTNSLSVEDLFLSDADWTLSTAGTLKWQAITNTATVTYLGVNYSIANISTTKNYALWSPTSNASGLTGGSGLEFYATDTVPLTLENNQFVIARLVSTAPYYVLQISSTIISGDYIITGLIDACEIDADIITVGTLNADRIAANSLTAVKLDINSMGMNSDIEFTPTDLDTVAWSSGNVAFADASKNSGTIAAGNTGNMAAVTYVFYDENVSTTALQTTTTYNNATGDGRVLLAVCEPQASGEAVITTNIIGTTISGNSVVTGIINANLVTVSSADGKMTLAGNVLTIKDGSDVDQVLLGKYDGVNYGLSAGGGNVIINDDGIAIDTGVEATANFWLKDLTSIFFGDTAGVSSHIFHDDSIDTTVWDIPSRSAPAPSPYTFRLHFRNTAPSGLQETSFIDIGNVNPAGPLVQGPVYMEFHDANRLYFYNSADAANLYLHHSTTNELELVGSDAFVVTGGVVRANTFWVPTGGSVGIILGPQFGFTTATNSILATNIDYMNVDGKLGVGVTPTARNNTDLQIINGVGFPVTQVASSDPNTLDDYEEGLYTGTLTPGTSGSITINGSFDQMAYTKIGRKVTVIGTLAVSSVSSPVGSLTINLPFVVADLTEQSDNAHGLVYYFGINAIGSGSALQLLTNQGTATAVILEMTTTGILSDVANHIIGSSQIGISLTYFTT